MTDELKPVRCGCGGEAKVDWTIINGYYMAGVVCSKCGTKTVSFYERHDKDKAITDAVRVWNRAMGERTAKVTKGAYDLMRCECGMPVSSNFDYCPICRARLEWK